MFGFRKLPAPANKIPKQNSVDPGLPTSSSSNPFDSDTESDMKPTTRPASKIPKQNSVDPGLPTSLSSNPFDSDTESDMKPTTRPVRRTSSGPLLITPNKSNFYDDDDDDWGRGKGSSSSSRTKNAYKSYVRDKKGFDKMSVQELESHAVNRSEDTTKSVNNCLKIAEDIRSDATRTLETLHHQGEQINKTHMMAVHVDRDLSKGEKLLKGLGGMFSKPWKATKSREIKGPAMSQDDNNWKQSSTEHREQLGLAKRRGNSRMPPPKPTNAMQKIEMEKEKQDDALSDLSNILGDLKGMATAMGSELNRQNKALDHLSDDVDELNSRVRGANQRARRLVGK